MATITFTGRDLITGVSAEHVCWQVERLRWRAPGGCWDGTLRAEGSSLAGLWGLASLLGCGVEVQGAFGPAWWGCARALTVYTDGQATTLTLDGLVNRARARYLRVLANTTTGEECWTGWHEDAASIAFWGRHEQVLRLGAMTAAEAEAAAAAALRGQPRLLTRAAETSDRCARLDVTGWWQTLDREIYQEERGAEGHDLPVDAASNGELRLGETAAVQALAQGFTVQGGAGWRLGEVWLRAARAGALDGLRLEVLHRAGAGTLLAEALLPAAEVGERMGWTRFVLPNGGVALQGGQEYWLRLWRTGAVDSGAYWRVAVDPGATYSDGELWQWDGSAWAARSPAADMPFWLAGVDDTLAQAARMARGQWIRAARVLGGPGPDGLLWRAGTRSRQAEAEALLRDAGCTADVSRERAARIWPDAPGEPRWQVGPGGGILTLDGQPAGLAADVAGTWALLGTQAAPGTGPRSVRLAWVTWDGAALRAG